MGLPPPATPARKLMTKRERSILRVYGCVLLGAIINFGVVCACIIFAVPPLTKPHQTIDVESALDAYASTDWPTSTAEARCWRGMAGDTIVMRPLATGSMGPLLPQYTVSVSTSGVPWRSFFKSEATPSEPGAPTFTRYGPIWPG